MDGLVLVAAGSSLRFGGTVPKVLRTIGGRTILVRSLAPFRAAIADLAVVVVARREDQREVRRLAPGALVVEGGATRQESVARGVAALPEAVRVVLVHDAARPLLTMDLVTRVLAAAVRDGAAAAVVPVTDSVHRLDVGTLRSDAPRLGAPVDRKGLVAAQTPQAARRELLVRALAEARAAGVDATDEIALLHRANVPVTAVEGERWNLKVTWPSDLALAEILVEQGLAT